MLVCLAAAAMNVAGTRLHSSTVRTRTTDSVFQDACNICERVLAGDNPEDAFAEFLTVPVLLREVFEADAEKYLQATRPGSAAQELMCLRPAALDLEADELEDMFGGAIRGDGLVDLSLEPGRVAGDVLDGSCSGRCSRVVMPEFATEAECAELARLASSIMAPPMENDDPDPVALTQLGLGDCAAQGHARTTLLFVRLVERLRRAVAHEYNLPLETVAPHTAFVSRWVAKGGCGSGTPVHGDEAACVGFHYSTVLHLDTQGDSFEGGDFVFSDRATAASACACAAGTAPLADAVVELGDELAHDEKSTAGRLLTRLSPQRGRAMMFSSGWENLHFVDEITAGVRHAMPAFFCTHAEWAEAGPEDMRGPVPQQDVASALWQHLLSPQDAEDQGQFTLLWHSLFAAPLVHCHDRN